MEYWPTIPASIMIMLMASGIATWFNRSILQTVDYLNPTDTRCEQTVEEEEPGRTQPIWTVTRSR